MSLSTTSFTYIDSSASSQHLSLELILIIMKNIDLKSLAALSHTSSHLRKILQNEANARIICNALIARFLCQMDAENGVFYMDENMGWIVAFDSIFSGMEQEFTHNENINEHEEYMFDCVEDPRLERKDLKSLNKIGPRFLYLLEKYDAQIAIWVVAYSNLLDSQAANADDWIVQSYVWELNMKAIDKILTPVSVEVNGTHPMVKELIWYFGTPEIANLPESL